MKKGLKTILVLFAVFALLTSCSKKEKADGAMMSSGANNVSIWTWTPIPRTINKMIGAFESDNTGIKISYTNYNRPSATRQSAECPGSPACLLRRCPCSD